MELMRVDDGAGAAAQKHRVSYRRVASAEQEQHPSLHCPGIHSLEMVVLIAGADVVLPGR